MEFKTLKTDIRNKVLYCWLNRPDKRNALNREMLGELKILFDKISTETEIRILVLRGSGKVFSAGADLSMMSDISGKSPEDLNAEAGLFYDCYDALYRLPVPTICHAHGGVHGGANGLVSACDYSLAEPGTRFSFGEVRLGLIPATVAPFVVRRTGLTNAKKMMLGGHSFEADDALGMGLVDALCSAAGADVKIRELTQQILENAPGALRETKQLLLEIGDGHSVRDLKEFCAATIASYRLSEEAREGIRAFFEKRNPSWVPDH